MRPVPRPARLPAALAAAALCLASCGGGADQGPLLGFAGAAAMPALDECAAGFAASGGPAIEIAYGGSGHMLSAVEMSGKGDFYLAGSPEFMDKAVSRGLVDPKTVTIVAYLVPCMLVRKGNPRGIRTIADLGSPGVKICIGDPESVCLGACAVEIFERSGLASEIGGNVVVHAESCSKVVSLVSMGKVDAAIGWTVSASWSPETVEAVAIDPAALPRIFHMSAAVCSSSARPAEARRFVAFLASAEGMRIFAAHGYIADEAVARNLAPLAATGGTCANAGGFGACRE